MLTVWLDYQRSTLLWKCDSLVGADLVRAGIPPSSLTLLGLVRHMTYVEWHWFAHVFAGGPTPPPISLHGDPTRTSTTSVRPRPRQTSNGSCCSATYHAPSWTMPRISIAWRHRLIGLCRSGGS